MEGGMLPDPLPSRFGVAGDTDALRQRKEAENHAYEIKIANTSNPIHLQWILGRQYPVLDGQLYFMSIREEAKLKELIETRRRRGQDDRDFFSIDNELLYFPFCADFGPLNYGCVQKFINILRKKLEFFPKHGKSVVLYTSADPKARTNAATLLGCFLILEMDMTPEEAWAPFEFSNAAPFIPFHEASFEADEFNLVPIDVLQGLYKAKQNGLLRLDDFDVEWYDYCDHPNHADLHEIVPGKFVAFKGPKQETVYHKETGVMYLAPKEYFTIFQRLDVTAVVRLNEPQYRAEDFKEAGFNHYDIYFDDCSTPDEEVLNTWFDVCRAEQGTIAVHCKAGLGRTGTLICAWLMRKYRFTAAEVIGFVRVMRPGSVLGDQQTFLEDNEDILWSLGDPDLPPIHPCGDLLVSDVEPDTEEDLRAKEAAARRAKENTDAMNRQAAVRAAAR
mmetsp:Transcript_25111/g.56686  ORF Transcript_25111/g.56686 Transcript_25111/m.56686 type:complete len:446 (-) Transcript_25111:48-1385(-)